MPRARAQEAAWLLHSQLPRGFSLPLAPSPSTLCSQGCLWRCQDSLCFPRGGRGCSSLQTPVLSAGIFKDGLKPEGWDAASSWVIASAGPPAQPAAPALHARFASGTLPCNAAQNNSEDRSRTCALPKYCTQVGQSGAGSQLALVFLWEVIEQIP